VAHIGKAAKLAQEKAEAEAGSLYASRVRVYPSAVHGRMRTIKWAVLCFCLGVYYLLPWLRWDRGEGAPNQAVLLDLAHRRFYFFTLQLWPQDIIYLAGLLILGAISLFLVTSLAGRVWCGYSCPQTVWTDLFMWVERLVEGDRNERMRRDAKPITFNAAGFDTIWRKAVKHGAWLGIAFWTGGAWIMYYVDAPTVTREFWTGTAATPVYVFTALFTVSTYLLAGWAREQVCTYMCPWPRFQAAMLDESSFTVTYQVWRGEPRTRAKHAPAEPGARVGDCVDCSACVTVCPTGIDIRDGIQLECINCGLCMDACDHVMQKLDRETGLIKWDTLERQTAKEQGKTAPVRLLRPRSMVYAAALVVALGVFATALLTRHTLSISVQRDRAPLFVTLPDGQLRNGYLLRVLNMTPVAGQYELRIADLPGAKMVVAGADQPAADTAVVPVGPDQVGTFRVLVTAAPVALMDGSERVTFVLRNIATGEETRYGSVFMGPAGFKPASPL
jgi:cytochrome c oxidase accessory protein FixG